VFPIVVPTLRRAEAPASGLEFGHTVPEVVGLERDLVAALVAPPEISFGIFFKGH
jgi:hypothetical protein